MLCSLFVADRSNNNISILLDHINLKNVLMLTVLLTLIYIWLLLGKPGTLCIETWGKKSDEFIRGICLRFEPKCNICSGSQKIFRLPNINEYETRRQYHTITSCKVTHICRWFGPCFGCCFSFGLFSCGRNLPQCFKTEPSDGSTSKSRPCYHSQKMLQGEVGGENNPFRIDGNWRVRCSFLPWRSCIFLITYILPAHLIFVYIWLLWGKPGSL